MKKSIIIFAIPCEPSAKQVAKLVGLAEKEFGGISTITVLSENDLIPHAEEKPDYIKYFDNLCTVCKINEFNKLLTVQRFWECIKAKIPGFDKEHFVNLINKYNTDAKIRDYVAVKHGGIIIELISQAIGMM